MVLGCSPNKYHFSIIVNMLNKLPALEIDSLKPKLGQNFLLVGGDAYLTDLALDHIRKNLETNVDLVIIYGDEAKVPEIKDLLDSYSIFSNAKLVLFRNVDQLKKKELDALTDYFSEPSEQQTLILTAEKIDDKKGSWKIISKACIHILCNPPSYSGALSPWLDKSLAKLDLTMSFKAKQAFISRVELDYANANNELQKLALLVGDKKEITENDVLRSIGFSRVGTQIDFYRALGNRQLKETMQLLERMLNSEFKVLQVLFYIIKFYDTIYHILLLKKAHISATEIMNIHLTNLYPSQRKEFMDFSNNYSLLQLQTIFNILLDTDTKIKSSSASDAVLLTNCIFKIMETL